MEEKYISKEVFEARIDVLEEKINSLTQIVEHTNDQLEIIAGLSKSVTEHQKDIESVRRETERNKERLRRLEENQSKIVWAVGVAILGGAPPTKQSPIFKYQSSPSRLLIFTFCQ